MCSSVLPCACRWRRRSLSHRVGAVPRGRESRMFAHAARLVFLRCRRRSCRTSRCVTTQGIGRRATQRTLPRRRLPRLATSTYARPCFRGVSVARVTARRHVSVAALAPGAVRHHTTKWRRHARRPARRGRHSAAAVHWCARAACVSCCAAACVGEDACGCCCCRALAAHRRGHCRRRGACAAALPHIRQSHSAGRCLGVRGSALPRSVSPSLCLSVYVCIRVLRRADIRRQSSNPLWCCCCLSSRRRGR
jgi:hypothetical protein